MLRGDKKSLLSDVLEKLGPCLSSQLSAAICEQENILPATARKRIERAKLSGEIAVVPGIKFRHNEQFVYTKSHAGTERLQKALFSALMESNSAYRLPLLGIQSRGGIVSEYLFPTISGFPLTSRERRQNCYEVLSYLVSAELLVKNEEAHKIYISSVFAPNSISESRYHSRLIAESVLLVAIRDWCQLQGLLSTEKFSIRDEASHPQYGFFQWDLVGPSYISPLSFFGKDNVIPGFIVADVILGRKLSIADITPFLQKISTVRANPNNRPCLAMLFSDWFEKDALIEGRKRGLLFTTPKNFFGKPFAELLDDFIQAFEHKSSFLNAEPDYLQKIISNIQAITHLHEASVVANRQLFLLLLGYCYSKLKDCVAMYDVVLGANFVADLWLETKLSVTVCKCIWKSDKTAVTNSDLDELLNSLPSIFDNLRRVSKSPSQIVFCTNRVFSVEATSKLNLIAQEYSVSWVDGPSLRTLLNSIDAELNKLIPSAYLN